ncbi:MAG: hypothetical protein Q8O84_05350 [Nanoarchaeota archaeon]|nr:hypothetical protein [Nanoarchaeota archaeon]
MKSKKSQDVKSKISSVSLFQEKRSQMKIQQMAFMLIAVMIFFALVGLLILSVGFSGLKEKASALQEENAKLLVSRLANSPEFSCGQAFGSKENCIDLDKVFVLKNNINNYKNKNKNFWGVSDIEIIRIYPANKNLICASANYPDCDTLKLISDPEEKTTGISAENFVSLCRKEYDSESYSTYDKCELGKVVVWYEKIQ